MQLITLKFTWNILSSSEDCIVLFVLTSRTWVFKLWFAFHYRYTKHHLLVRGFNINPKYTECPTRYRTRNFFNNSNTNVDIATKFEQHMLWCRHISYTMRYVRFKFRCNILVSGKIIKEMPSSVASGTLCTKGQNFKKQQSKYI